MNYDVLKNLSDIEYNKFQEYLVFYQRSNDNYTDYDEGPPEIDYEITDYIMKFENRALQIISQYENYGWQKITFRGGLPFDYWKWLNERNIHFVKIYQPVSLIDCIFIRNASDFLLFKIKCRIYINKEMINYCKNILHWIEYDVTELGVSLESIKRWCNENCQYLFLSDEIYFFFESESDLMHLLMEFKDANY